MEMADTDFATCVQAQSAATVFAAEDIILLVKADGSVEKLTGAVLSEPFITKALFDAYTILMATTDNTPAPITIAEQTVVGRLTGGAIKALSVTELTALINAGTTSLKGALVLATNAEALTGTDTAKALTADDLAYVLTQGNARRWKTIPAANFTARPPSTSTITMGVDMTATVKVGDSLEYTWNSNTYYGQVAAIANNLLTVRGAPLSASYDVTLLRFGGGMVRQIQVIIPGTYEDASNTALITSDLKSSLQWGLAASYLVYYRVYSNTHDTGTHGQASVRINGTEVNTTTGGLTIAADATWYSTAVDIAAAAYDVQPGEAIEVTAVKNGNGDASDLTVEMIFVTP